MDTDALLQPTHMTKNQVIALMDVVKANTAALKEIKLDLTKCDHQDKVAAILSKADKAIVDLAMDSQKIPPWVKVTPMDVPLGSSQSEFYGQYTVDRPLNPDNPVPWPPGYTPPQPDQGAKVMTAPPPPPPVVPAHEKEKASEAKHKK
jgi:hypothetical protein